MHPRSPKLLEDVRDAAAFIREVTTGVSLAQYSANRLLRHAVERNFEIIGEAVKRRAWPPPPAGRSTHHLIGKRSNAAFTNSSV